MFVGDKKVRDAVKTKETTPGGGVLMQVTYADGTLEYIPKKSYDVIVSKKACSATELQEKRVAPAVQETIGTLREWGLRIGDTQYFSQLVNQSLNYNIEQAVLKLWSEYTPKHLSQDDVSLSDVDRVLKDG